MGNLTVWQTKSLPDNTSTVSIVTRGALFAGVMILLVSAVGFMSPASDGASHATHTELERSLSAAERDLSVATVRLERAERIIDYSTRFGIAADLAAMINDVALSERIDPELAFRLISVESGFKPTAVSPVGAIGMAQVMLGTAQYFSPGITRSELMNPETNLRIGLKHLGYLLDRYDDEEYALLAYNRGANRITELLDADADPRNGYASSIMDGYLR